MKKMKVNKKGFTLLELLVVVLIIGILGAIALPQYKKSVLRAKAAQVDVILSTTMKAVNEYLTVQGGFPDIASSTVYLTGDNSSSSIEMPGNCSDDVCYTDVGGFWASCDFSGCSISLNFSYNADGTSGNKWLISKEDHVTLRKDSPEGPWEIDERTMRKIDKNSSSAEERRAAEIICPILERYIPPNDGMLESNCY